MQVRLTRAVDFATSLRLVRSDLSDEENRALFGPESSHHGHNYRLEVTLRGDPDPVTGMVMDLKRLQDLLEREIVERFDHRDLNADTPYFEKEPPTLENLAAVLFRLLGEVLPEGQLDRIRLWQDEDLWVDVTPPEPAA